MPESSHGNSAMTQVQNPTPDSNISGIARRGRQSGRNPKAIIQCQERFEGKCEGWKGHIYNLSRGAMKKGETFGRVFDKGGELRTGMVKLRLPELIQPVTPDDPNNDKVGFEVWKYEFARYKKDSTNRKKNEQKAYALVMGLCSPVVRDIIEANQEWHSINNQSNVIELLKLIHQAVVSENTSRHEVHSYIDATHVFYSLRQSPMMSHSEYLDKMKYLVKIVLQHGGEMGGDRIRVRQYIKNKMGRI